MTKNCWTRSIIHKRGSGLEMTQFFNNKQVLMENVSFQDLTPKLFQDLEFICNI